MTGGGTYGYGSTATLTAIPNEGYIFLFWNDHVGTNPRNITVTANASYTATFMLTNPTIYTVTVLSSDTLLGEVSGGGEYPEGTTIEISATPGPQAYFKAWDDGNTDNPRSIVVTQDMTFTAIFERNPQDYYTITVVSDNPLMGSVSGGGTFPANVTTLIEATPSPNCYFVGWQDGVTDNPRQILVDHDITLAAFFKPAGVDENGGSNIHLFPNPANNEIHFDGLDGESEISIFNTFGVCVKTLTIDGNDGISVADLAAGLYLIRINGKQTVRFVKR